MRHRRDEPVPTAIEAVTAWRGWSLVEQDGELRLSSLTRPEVWAPRAPHAATCPKGRRPTPQRRCRCGVYATTTPEALAGLRSLPGGVVGEVSLWGRVIEHGQGYRAEIGYPARVGLVCVACLAEGSGRRATAVERMEIAGRTRLVPWCVDHAPPTAREPARTVESSLLSVYAVDPIADELVGRIDGSVTSRRARGDDDRRRPMATLVAAALAIVLITIAAVISLRGPSHPAAALGSGRTRLTGPKTHQDSAPPAEDALGIYPPMRVVFTASGDVSDPICGHAEGTTVHAVDCRDDGANAYVYDTSAAAHDEGVCSDHTDLATVRGDRILCWRRFIGVG